MDRVPCLPIDLTVAITAMVDTLPSNDMAPYKILFWNLALNELSASLLRKKGTKRKALGRCCIHLTSNMCCAFWDYSIQYIHIVHH